MRSESVFKAIQGQANPQKALILSRFFKTGPGEYGQGDIFLGLSVPEQRKIAKEFSNLSFREIKKLIQPKIHEHRLIALFVLIDRYEKGSDSIKQRVFNFYCSYLERVNNWDLVDLSAPKIIGAYLFDRPRDLLFKLAQSENMWFRRISIISTHYFIRQNDLKDALKISGLLIYDKEDLIHKAVGWTLREVGKKDMVALESFLKKNVRIMSRTMLRYSIEKLSEQKRKYYLKKK